MPPPISRWRPGAALGTLLAGTLLAGFLLAGALPAAALSPEEARHLLVRTGYAASPSDIRQLLPLHREQAVARLLNRTRTAPAVTPPGWSARPAPFKKIRSLPKAERQKEMKIWRQRQADLKVWWLREMVETDSPLTERMTLFWHNHFTSELRKVRAPMLMYRQNALFRRHAVGNFGELLHLVTVDPAMLIYLDGRSSRKDSPNENFARELLELFTLGEGHYTEQDIKQAARAFTGWTVDDRGEAVFRPQRHDPGEKVLFGQRGRFEGHDVVRLLLTQARTAEHIVEKLWRAFISGTPRRRDVQRLAATFRRANHDIKPLMQALLTSDAFWDRDNRGVLIKSPVALFVGALRQFGVGVGGGAKGSGMRLIRASRRLGQDLLDPPSVKGWDGGTDWITADSLVSRQDFLSLLFRAREMDSRKAGKNRKKTGGTPMMRQRLAGADLARWVDQLPRDWRRPEAMTLLLLPIAPVDDPMQDPGLRAGPPADLVRHLLRDPAYQLM